AVSGGGGPAPEVEHRLRRASGRFLVCRHVASRKDDAGGTVLAQEAVRDITGMDLAIHACLAHAARDELGVLGAEVEDQNLLMLTRLGNWGPPSRFARRARGTRECRRS